MRYLLAVSLALAACGGPQSTSRVSASDAIVYLKANVRDANVFVDGRFIGPVAMLKGGMAIEPGTHRVEVRHEDYFSAYVEMNLARASKQTVQITLAPVLP